MSGRYHSYDKGSSRSTRDDSRQYRERREGRDRRRSRSRSPRRWSPPGRRHSRDRSPNSRERDYKDTRHSTDYEEVVPAPPPPPRITKISIDFNKPKAPPIKMNIGGPAVPAAPKVKPTIASVFNADDDEEEPEEMPAEARMRMRNIGRETPTSAGPNSFGKTKQGFCDAKKVFEKNLKNALDMADKPGAQKLPQTIYKIKDHLPPSEHRLQQSPPRPWEASTDAPLLPPPPPPPLLQEATASDTEHVFAISYHEATRRNTDADTEPIPSTCTAPTSPPTSPPPLPPPPPPVRSTQSYAISNFDPSINDINTWCEEVDRAKILNNWDDVECISRIRCCLKGDASSWLDQWKTYSLTWSNFKTDFNPLCPRKPDVADILFEVMSTDSDKFASYADYARRSLLMLRTVKGLSDELISAIVVRGITDPETRALATNAKLPPGELVQFFSIHVQPNLNQSIHNKKSNNNLPKNKVMLKSNDVSTSPPVPSNMEKGKYQCFNGFQNDPVKKDVPKVKKCRKCCSTDHLSYSCPLRINKVKPNPLPNPSNITTIDPSSKIIEGTKNTDDKIIEATTDSNNKIIEATTDSNNKIIGATVDPNDKIIDPNDKVKKVKQKKKKKLIPKKEPCDFCKIYGHTTAECFRRVYVCGKTCDICDKVGHSSVNCFLAKRKCGNCKKIGHRTGKCPLPKKVLKCDFCMGQGHEAATCFKKQRLQVTETCNFCKKPGHTEAKCVAKLWLNSSFGALVTNNLLQNKK